MCWSQTMVGFFGFDSVGGASRGVWSVYFLLRLADTPTHYPIRPAQAPPLGSCVPSGRRLHTVALPLDGSGQCMPVLGRRYAVEQASRDCLQQVQGVCPHLVGIVSEGSCCASLGQFGVPCVPSFGLRVPVEDGGGGARSRAHDCYSQSSNHDSAELGFRYM